jgi:hypothetical protein
MCRDQTGAQASIVLPVADQVLQDLQEGHQAAEAQEAPVIKVEEDIDLPLFFIFSPINLCSLLIGRPRYLAIKVP